MRLIKYALAPPLYCCMVITLMILHMFYLRGSTRSLYKWSAKAHLVLVLISMRLFARRKNREVS